MLSKAKKGFYNKHIFLVTKIRANLCQHLHHLCFNGMLHNWLNVLVSPYIMSFVSTQHKLTLKYYQEETGRSLAVYFTPREAQAPLRHMQCEHGFSKGTGHTPCMLWLVDMNQGRQTPIIHEVRFRGN